MIKYLMLLIGLVIGIIVFFVLFFGLGKIDILMRLDDKLFRFHPLLTSIILVGNLKPCILRWNNFSNWHWIMMGITLACASSLWYQFCAFKWGYEGFNRLVIKYAKPHGYYIILRYNHRLRLHSNGEIIV